MPSVAWDAGEGHQGPGHWAAVEGTPDGNGPGNTKRETRRWSKTTLSTPDPCRPIPPLYRGGWLTSGGPPQSERPRTAISDSCIGPRCSTYGPSKGALPYRVECYLTNFNPCLPILPATC